MQHDKGVLAPPKFLRGRSWRQRVTDQLPAGQGKLDKAKTLLIAGLENLRHSLGDHHLLTRQARDRLVGFYRATGRDAGGGAI